MSSTSSILLTSEALVSFLFDINEGTPKMRIIELFRNLWDSRDVTETMVLRAMFYLRDPRGGKGLKKEFFVALDCLLREVGTDFFAEFLNHFGEFGCYGDLMHCLTLKSCNFDIRTQIVNFVAKTLREDLALLGNKEGEDLHKFLSNKEGEEKREITRMAKWAPTENGGVDRKYNIVSDISAALGITKREYRKNYLVPLRGYWDLVEHKMCSGQWNQINFSTVPAKAMKHYRKLFLKHCPERFKIYLSTKEKQKEEKEKEEKKEAILDSDRYSSIVYSGGDFKSAFTTLDKINRVKINTSYTDISASDTSSNTSSDNSAEDVYDPLYDSISMNSNSSESEYEAIVE